MMDLLNTPRILFFKQEDNSIQLDIFKEKTWAFLYKNFSIKNELKSYSSVSYSPPERDNQFMETYTRSVYHVFTLVDGKEFVLYFYEEASDKNDFVETWIYNFYQCSIYSTQPTDWEWVKNLWESFKPFLLELGFRDATLDFTYAGGGLYDFYEKQQNYAASQEIAILTEDSFLEHLKSNPQTYLEIQFKPYLDIDRILLQIPNKEEITSIRIPNNNLTHFPTSLAQYKNLEELYIYNNKIKTVPDFFQDFQRLRYLHIRGNDIAMDTTIIQKLRAILPADGELILT